MDLFIPATIEASLTAIGFGHRADDHTQQDGRRTVYRLDGSAIIGRYDALEAAALAEAFYWQDANGSHSMFLVGCINARLAAHAHPFEPQSIYILDEHYEHVMANGGVEEWKISRLDESHRDRPVLFAHMDDGTDLLIDGNHRIARRYRDGHRDALAYILPRGFWLPYQVAP